MVLTCHPPSPSFPGANSVPFFCPSGRPGRAPGRCVTFLAVGTHRPLSQVLFSLFVQDRFFDRPLRRNGLRRRPTFGVASSVLAQVTVRPAENSDVLPNGSVAVAVMTWPGAIVKPNVAVNVALPVASVVTVTEPRKVLPWLVPDGLLKNSSV